MDGEPARVTTSDGHVISADNVVVCTNTPVNDWLIIHSKQAAYRTYVIGARVPRGSVPHGLYWDTLDPYHYIRLQQAEDSSGNATGIGNADLVTRRLVEKIDMKPTLINCITACAPNGQPGAAALFAAGQQSVLGHPRAQFPHPAGKSPAPVRPDLLRADGRSRPPRCPASASPRPSTPG